MYCVGRLAATLYREESETGENNRGSGKGHATINRSCCQQYQRPPLYVSGQKPFFNEFLFIIHFTEQAWGAKSMETA